VLRFRLFGLSLMILSVTAIVLAYFSLFLGYRIPYLNIKLPSLVLHAINFLVVVIVFGFIAYVGYVIFFTTNKE